MGSKRTVRKEAKQRERRTELMARSPYNWLFDDPDFLRFFQNLKRGSPVTAYEAVRRMGKIHKIFQKTPQDLAKMTSKQATDFVLDVVTTLEAKKFSPNYIDNLIKPLKAWFNANQILLLSKIKVSGTGDSVKYEDETVPTPQELRTILNAPRTKERERAAISIIAFTGVRPEVLGNYLGDDGLEVKDFPEIHIDENKQIVRFEIQNKNTGEWEPRIPTRIRVRKSLSKARHKYETYLCDEGCQHVIKLLEQRMRGGEKLVPTTPIITQKFERHSDKVNFDYLSHMRTTNINHRNSKNQPFRQLSACSVSLHTCIPFPCFRFCWDSKSGRSIVN